MNWSLIPSKGKRFFSPPKCPDWLWGPCRYQGLLPWGQRGCGMRLPNHLHLWLQLQMGYVGVWVCTCRLNLYAPYTHSWHAKKLFYCHIYSRRCGKGENMLPNLVAESRIKRLLGSTKHWLENRFHRKGLCALKLLACCMLHVQSNQLLHSHVQNQGRKVVRVSTVQGLVAAAHLEFCLGTW